MLSYSTELLIENQQDLLDLRSLLEDERIVFNFASQIQFLEKKNSIKILHDKVYKNIRKLYPNIKSCVVICAQKSCLASYKSIKTQKHSLKTAAIKHKLSIQLDHNLYLRVDNKSIKLSTNSSTRARKTFRFKLYPKLQELLSKYDYKDPSLFINESNNKIYINFPFDLKPEISLPQTKAIGIDLGIRRSAAMSDGRIIIDKKFNEEKRKLLYLKRKLNSKGTKTARKHLKNVKRKEKNKNNNQTHLLSNMILKTDADTLVFEDLKGLKKKKKKFQNKRRISQVPFFRLLQIVTYKALHQGKRVVTVNPHYTSQINHKTGFKDGIRQGCRYYTNKNGIVYDSDLNGSNNIVLRSEHPFPCITSALDGQVLVNVPNTCKPRIYGSCKFLNRFRNS